MRGYLDFGEVSGPTPLPCVPFENVPIHLQFMDTFVIVLSFSCLLFWGTFVNQILEEFSPPRFFCEDLKNIILATPQHSGF